VFRLL